jgi:hypothetical protein
VRGAAKPLSISTLPLAAAFRFESGFAETIELCAFA